MVIKGLGNQEIDTAQQVSSEAGSMLQHQVNVWRRERDSNPRYGFPYSGFQDRLFQPLTHPSAVNQQFVSLVYIRAQTALRGDFQAAPVKVLQFFTVSEVQTLWSGIPLPLRSGTRNTTDCDLPDRNDTRAAGAV